MAMSSENVILQFLCDKLFLIRNKINMINILTQSTRFCKFIYLNDFIVPKSYKKGTKYAHGLKIFTNVLGNGPKIGRTRFP